MPSRRMCVVGQVTLASSGDLVGVGLHSGQRVAVSIKPAVADTGIVFRRTDLDLVDTDIPARAECVSNTRLNTTLSNAAGASVATVEHLLSAVFGLGVDNAIIEIDGPEVPAMDGSALTFARVIADAGVRTLAAPQRRIRVMQSVSVELDGLTARFEPADACEIDVSIDFDDAAIGRQRAVLAVRPDTFLDDIAPARTFARLRDVEALRAAGLALGGTLDNCIVVDGDEVLNEGGLRFANEFVRHKILDAVGDLALAGRPIIGRYVADRPSHALNNVAVRALLAARSAWAIDVGDVLDAPNERRRAS